MMPCDDGANKINDVWWFFFCSLYLWSDHCLFGISPLKILASVDFAEGKSPMEISGTSRPTQKKPASYSNIQKNGIALSKDIHLQPWYCHHFGALDFDWSPTRLQQLPIIQATNRTKSRREI